MAVQNLGRGLPDYQTGTIIVQVEQNPQQEFVPVPVSTISNQIENRIVPVTSAGIAITSNTFSVGLMLDVWVRNTGSKIVNVDIGSDLANANVPLNPNEEVTFERVSLNAVCAKTSGADTTTLAVKFMGRG